MNFYVGLIIVLLVIAVIWLICREFFCWYWKINERRDILSAIHEDLSALNEIQKNLSKLDDVCSKLDNLNDILSSSSTSSTNGKSDENYTITRNAYDRIFAMKDGQSFCPSCHAPAPSETATVCSNCGHSFME